MRFILLVIIIALFILSGCVEEAADDPFPQPLALGGDISTFKPPAITETGDLPEEPAVSPQDFADPNGVINLRQALALALLGNPELISFSWQVRAGQAAELQASLKPNPELSLDVEDFGGSNALKRFKGAETTFAISRLIEVAGKRQKRQKVASLEKQIAALDYESKRLAVFSEVNKAYTDVLSFQQRLKLDGELLRLSEELVKTVSGRVEAGKDPPLDETKAQIVLANIRILYRQAENELDFARSDLAGLWASDAKFTKAAGKLTMPAEIPPLSKLTGYIDDNPELAKYGIEVEKALASYKLEKARSKQDITISAGFKRVEQNDTNAYIVGINLPIGTSDRNQGNRRRAVYQLASARQRQRAVKSDLQTELAEYYKEMANAFTAATEYKEKIIPAAKAVFKASKTSYTEGKIDYLDVLNSQQMLFQSLSRHVDTLRDYHKAKARIERIIARPIINNQ